MTPGDAVPYADTRPVQLSMISIRTSTLLQWATVGTQPLGSGIGRGLLVVDVRPWCSSSSLLLLVRPLEPILAGVRLRLDRRQVRLVELSFAFVPMTGRDFDNA